MLYLLYSADYELYLGRNHQPEEAVLIQPTAALLATCEQLAIPLTLFADVACLWRYRELGRKDFPARAEAQLVTALQRGHDVQTHLHPHWSQTRMVDGCFHFDPRHYRLGTWSEDPEERFRNTSAWLRQAADYLTTLLRPHDPGYRCLAFRAGGYGLQPDEKMILQALLDTGYRIDSSIIPGARLTSAVQQVDFTRLPDSGNFWIDPAHGLDRPAPEGQGLFEIPIAAGRFDPWQRLMIRGPEAVEQAAAILLDRAPPPLRGEPCHLPPPPPPARSWKRAYWRARAVLASDFQRLELGANPRSLLACLERHLEAAPRKTLFLSMNIHPKGVHPTHLKTLTRFHHTLAARLGDQFQAITFQQAWERLRQSSGSEAT
ncbi:MAG: hypothetical protein HQL95_01880 [Magnetococcales bacterium]|nr:hypothetical protein [Magnetococcales bacterium]